jgi:hypothetical protein
MATTNTKSPRNVEQGYGYASAGGAIGPMSVTTLPGATLSTPERIRYENLTSMTDPIQFTMSMNQLVEQWRSTPSANPAWGNKLNEMTATLRGLKLSKGVSGAGVWTTQDSMAFKNVMADALATGITVEARLTDYATQFNQKETTTTFSKSISSALSLLDEGDAKNALSKAYYTSFGYYPSEKQSKDFLGKWNAEVKRQKSTTTTTGTSTGKGSGSVVGTSTSVTSGQGFTQEEQADFLARYLKKNYKLKGDIKGEVKNIYDQIANTAKNNLLPPPSFEEAQKDVLNILGTGDAKIREQKLAEIQQKYRTKAKVQHPGWAENLDAGNDLSIFAGDYANEYSQKLGRQVKFDDPLVAKVMSFKDDKGVYRPASRIEANNLLKGEAEWATSPDAKTYWTKVADTLASKMGR